MKNMELLQGDCLDVMKNIEDKSVDLVLCDLPYGVMAAEWDKIIDFEKLWTEYKRIVKENGTFILFANGSFTVKVINSNVEMYKYKYVWIKSNSTFFTHAKNRPLTKHEDILIFSHGSMGHKNLLGDKRMFYTPQGLVPYNKSVKGKRKFKTDGYRTPRKSHKEEYIQEFTNYPTDILDGFPEPQRNQKFHPNEKPISLLEHLILTYTEEGHTVLDNCMGSGSTGLACKNTNRNFVGIEKDEKYFSIAKLRMEGE